MLRAYIESVPYDGSLIYGLAGGLGVVLCGCMSEGKIDFLPTAQRGTSARTQQRRDLRMDVREKRCGTEKKDEFIIVAPHICVHGGHNPRGNACVFTHIHDKHTHTRTWALIPDVLRRVNPITFDMCGETYG